LEEEDLPYLAVSRRNKAE